MAPVIRAAKQEGLETVVCLTAQHRDMLDQMLDAFDIRADYDLDIMREAQSPLLVAARICEALPKVIGATQPDWLLVQGDTTTAFAAALVGYHHRVRVGHVEAGLRSHDKWQPFPEEINRKLVACLADFHFAPTERACKDLQREGVSANRILVTGNTVVDAVLDIVDRPWKFSDTRLNSLSGEILLVTAHRRENLGARLEQICMAVCDLCQRFPEITVVFPVHRNPAVVETVNRMLEGHPKILLIDPLPYHEFVWLMKRAALILSDSGGVQEEAPSIGTRVLVLRDVTERPEAIEAGWAQLVGTSREQIVKRASIWLKSALAARGVQSPGANPFGDGKASQRIVKALKESG